MNNEEILNILTALIILTIILGLESMIKSTPISILLAFIFALIILVINITTKKIIGYKLDANVKHEIWRVQQFGFKNHHKLKKPSPFGIILPIVFSILSLGTLKIMTLLTYETTALKRRAARRHGPFSFTEMTDFHNAVIGASGIIAILALSLITYFVPGLENLSRFATLYAFFNMIPISNLDGSQIYFGSRILWYSLAIITLIFTAYAILLI